MKNSRLEFVDGMFGFSGSKKYATATFIEAARGLNKINSNLSYAFVSSAFWLDDAQKSLIQDGLRRDLN